MLSFRMGQLCSVLLAPLCLGEKLFGGGTGVDFVVLGGERVEEEGWEGGGGDMGGLMK